MRFACWNVNSIRVRQEQVIEWLARTQVDVLLLQEIRCPSEKFPSELFEQLGYQSLVIGRADGRAGVVIASRLPLQVSSRDLPGDQAPHARYLEAKLPEMRIVSLYAPSGEPRGSDKHDFKLQWFERLRQRVAVLLTQPEPLVLGGDYNIVPADIDVYNPKTWGNTSACCPESRQAWHALIQLGLADAWRSLHPEQVEYTWWDYRHSRWDTNHGLRLDHFLVCPQISRRLRGCSIERNMRAYPRPSDHVPVVLELGSSGN